MSQTFKVVVTDQVFPSIATETQLLAAIGARIEVADGTPEGVARIGGDADALLNTYLPITGQLLARPTRACSPATWPACWSRRMWPTTQRNRSLNHSRRRRPRSSRS